MEKALVLCSISTLFVLVACAGVENATTLNAETPLENGLPWTFYKSTCPKLESIVEERIQFYLEENITQVVGLLHLHFVQDCAAWVLLDDSASEPSEEEAPPNLTLQAKATEIINDIKERVEKACGVTLSCSDIIHLASSDSISERSEGTDRELQGRKLLQPHKPKPNRGDIAHHY